MGYWIVVVDDEPISLKNAKMLLNTENMKVSCLRSGAELLEFLDSNEPDLILLDVLMPEMDGFETIAALREFEKKNKRHWTPVIFLTGENDTEVERRGLKEGASDFIHKPFDRDVLIERITNTIESARRIESLTTEAKIDKLTGFLNKASGTQKISDLCSNRRGALVLFDLDNFKLVNDLFGHDMGDKILVAFSGILTHNVRTDDVTSRIGGDEFMAFLPNLTSKESIEAITERINNQLSYEADKLMGNDHDIPLGVSVGAAFAPEHSAEYEHLFQFADMALYRSKQNGKHGCSIYEPISENEHNKENLELEIDRISQIMEERGDKTGALILGKDAFSWNYRFITRFIDRYDTIATKILFALSSDKNSIASAETCLEFSRVMQKNLRRSDILYQNRPNQFFVVLPLLTLEDAPKVIDRIMSSWQKNGDNQNITINYSLSLIKNTQRN